MEINRRKWFRQAGLIIAGTGIASLDTIASPIVRTGYFLPGSIDGPVVLRFNENPYGPSPMARAAMADHINSSNRYPWQMIKDLMSAVAAKNKLADGNVLVGAGSTQIIDACIQLASLQKGNFIVADPTFDRWKGAAEKMGLKKISVPLTADKRHDLAAMQAAVNADTRMVYICNPNNPTGTICKHEELVSFIKHLASKTLVVVDEAYLDYTNETSLSALVTEHENLIVIKTFSKIYGMAGARVGYALAHTSTIDTMGDLQSGSNFGISAASIAGATVSLKDNDFVKESYAQNEKAKAYTIDQMERLHISCIPSHSNFIYFSLANYKKDFFELLNANNILGTGIFEETGKWSRITVGTMPEMKKFISAIQ